MEPTKFTKAEVEAFIAKWKPRLYLGGWAFYAVRRVLKPTTSAQTEIDSVHMAADIVVCKEWASKFRNFIHTTAWRYTPQQQKELDVVHEFLHVVNYPREDFLRQLFARVKTHDAELAALIEETYEKLTEYQCNLLARVLVDADSGAWANGTDSASVAPGGPDAGQEMASVQEAGREGSGEGVRGNPPGHEAVQEGSGEDRDGRQDQGRSQADGEEGSAYPRPPEAVS